MVFRDRHDAGSQLAAKLKPMKLRQPIVLALPRGGVPVGFEVAEELNVPLELLIVRKIGAPHNPEFAIGAVAEDGTTVVDQGTISALGISDGTLTDLAEGEVAELQRRRQLYRLRQESPEITGCTVIITDDGMATGLTDLAAVRAARAKGASQIVLAVPVSSPQAITLLSREVDEVVCVYTPDYLDGVGRWYGDFSPVQDEEVLALLSQASA